MSWLTYTKGPELFQHQLLAIVTASACQPQGYPAGDQPQAVLLRTWRGNRLYSSATREAQLSVLMRATDEMFDRALAKLACTSFRARCWLASYWKQKFWTKPTLVYLRGTRPVPASRPITFVPLTPAVYHVRNGHHSQVSWSIGNGPVPPYAGLLPCQSKYPMFRWERSQREE